MSVHAGNIIKKVLTEKERYIISDIWAQRAQVVVHFHSGEQEVLIDVQVDCTLGIERRVRINDMCLRRGDPALSLVHNCCVIFFRRTCGTSCA